MAGRAGEVDGETAVADVLVLGVVGEQIGPVGEGVHAGGAPRGFDPQSARTRCSWACTQPWR